MAIDWTKIFGKYKGSWVALKDDERTVVGSGKTAHTALKRAKEKGYTNPILTRMPANLNAIVG